MEGRNATWLDRTRDITDCFTPPLQRNNDATSVITLNVSQGNKKDANGLSWLVSFKYCCPYIVFLYLENQLVVFIAFYLFVAAVGFNAIKYGIISVRNLSPSAHPRIVGFYL
jgi:hypothetical protein